MDITERDRILTEIRTQLASGDITIGQAVRRLRKEITGLQQARFAQMCKLSCALCVSWSTMKPIRPCTP